MDRRDDVHWTAKGPLMLLGMLFLGGAMLAGARGRVIAAIVAAVMAMGFLVWSNYYKDWCAVHGTSFGQSAWGEGAFGGSLSECVREKRWFQF